MIRFFFVGVGKCGTSWIHRYLSGRSEIATPTLKETYFIDAGPRRRRRILRRLYRGDDRPLADFSNVSYWDPDNPAKILAYNPDARIVVTVRRPSSRAVSHYRFLKRSGMIGEQPLGDYLAAGDPEHVVARSDYRPIIARYQRAFGADRVLVLPLELLAADPQAYADRLCAFLDIPRRPLTGIEREVVLPAQRSRSPIVTRAGRVVAALLRRLGFLGVIGRVKGSPAAQRLLFVADVDHDDAASVAGRHPRLAELDADYPALLVEHGLPVAPVDQPAG